MDHARRQTRGPWVVCQRQSNDPDSLAPIDRRPPRTGGMVMIGHPRRPFRSSRAVLKISAHILLAGSRARAQIQNRSSTGGPAGRAGRVGRGSPAFTSSSEHLICSILKRKNGTHGKHRPTRTHYTRSGGRHVLFAPDQRVRCTASKLWKHIDTVRADTSSGGQEVSTPKIFSPRYLSGSSLG